MQRNVKTSDLPKFLVSSIKDNQKKFTKRDVSVRVADSEQIGGSMHAPQYDNFDYSYYILVDLKSRSVEFPQKGLQPNQTKSVRIEDDQFLVYGNKLENYASLTCNSNTFDKHFGDLKTVTQMLKGATLELMRLIKKA